MIVSIDVGAKAGSEAHCGDDLCGQHSDPGSR